MTAIAGFIVNTVPVIIGDVLFSTEGDAGFSIRLPGSGDNSKAFAKNRTIAYYPAKLGQKVTVINRNLLIATAGSLKVAKDFVNYLREDEQINSRPTWDYVTSFISTFNYDDKYDFAFILYYYNKEENISAMTGHNTRSVKMGGYEGLRVAGSGSEEIIKALADIDITYQDEGIGDGVKGALKVNGLISRLWSMDITNQKNIEQAFGGGYEIGTLKNDGVTKIGDLLFLEIFITGTPDKMLIGFNTRITKFDYANEDFIIRVMQLVLEEGSAIKDFKESMFIPKVENRGFIIPPIDFSGEYVVDENSLRNLPDFNAEHTNIHLQVDAENGQHLSAVFSEWRPQRNSPIEFNGNEFYITPKLWSKLLIAAQDFLKDNTKEE